MTTIGYATLQIIPSLDGVSAAVDRQLGGTLKVAGKQGGKQFSAGVADGMKAGEADVKRALDGYSKLYDKAADQAGKLKVAEAALQDLREKGISSGARYERAIAAQEKAQRDLNRSMRDSKDAFAAFERAQRDAANGAGDAGGDAGGGFLEGFTEGIAGLGAKAGPIGAGLTAAAGIAIGAGMLIGKQVMAGMEREVASDRISAQLGLSEGQAAQFGASSGKVYANNFGESLGDVNAAMADVASTLGTNAPSAVIEDMTQKALTFRDVFGTDVSESIAFAQNAIVNGLAPDAAGAFDLMTTAYQRVPAAMRDELPEILSEYSTYFQSLGFSGEEAFGLLVKTAPQGKIALDKVGDSLKEFTLLATDIGAKPVQDALTGMGMVGADVANNLLAGGAQAQGQFDQIIDGLLRIPDAGQQASAAIALFGTPLEDLDKAKIPAFLSSLDNAESSMQGFAGSAGEMVKTAGDNAAGSVEAAKRQIELAMGGMQGQLAQAFGPLVVDLANSVVAHQGDIISSFTTVANAGAEFGAAILGTTGGIVLGFGTLVGAVGDTVGFMVDGFEQMTGAAATVAGAFGMDGLAGDLREAQASLGATSDSLHGAGEGLSALGTGMLNAASGLHDFDANANNTAASAQNAQAQINNVATAMAALPGGKNIDITAIVTFKDATGLVISPDQLRTPSYTPAVPGESPSTARLGGRADGGSITGPGGPKSDIIPILASNGEHMWTAEEVNAIGGHANMERLRAAVLGGGFGKFATGGAIGAAVSTAQSMDGLPYIYGARDCSKVQSDIYAALTGKPTTTRYFTTESDFEALGFVKGYAEGAYNIGVRRGGGGKLSHMAGTLPNGVPFEAGGADSTVKYGGDAAGAEDFPLQYYLPVTGGDDPSAATSASPFAGGSAIAAAVGGGAGGAASSSGGSGNSSASSAGSGGGSGSSFKMPSSFSELAGMAVAGMGVTTKVTPDTPERTFEFGNAAAEAIGGQVSSLGDVFGVGGSPGWLKGASEFISGISINGGGGGSAGPLSATPAGSAAPLPDDAGNMHGGRAGQAPGPTYNITARDTEDAFIRAQRLEREKSAAKLSRF